MKATIYPNLVSLNAESTTEGRTVCRIGAWLEDRGIAAKYLWAGQRLEYDYSNLLVIHPASALKYFPPMYYSQVWVYATTLDVAKQGVEFGQEVTILSSCPRTHRECIDAGIQSVEPYLSVPDFDMQKHYGLIVFVVARHTSWRDALKVVKEFCRIQPRIPYIKLRILVSDFAPEDTEIYKAIKDVSDSSCVEVTERLPWIEFCELLSKADMLFHNKHLTEAASDFEALLYGVHPIVFRTRKEWIYHEQGYLTPDNSTYIEGVLGMEQAIKEFYAGKNKLIVRKSQAQAREKTIQFESWMQGRLKPKGA